eukprot:XP_019073144.1 PREDICTED: auxilin-related protein 2-like [Vitis vinifera]
MTVKNCKAKNPQVTKPTLGWLHMTDLSDAQTRANVGRGSKLQRSLSGIAMEVHRDSRESKIETTRLKGEGHGSRIIEYLIDIKNKNLPETARDWSETTLFSYYTLFKLCSALLLPYWFPLRNEEKTVQKGGYREKERNFSLISRGEGELRFTGFLVGFGEGEHNSLEAEQYFLRGGSSKTRNNGYGHAEGLYGDEFETNLVAAASAAAMKEAMDRAEAKFRHAKGIRERESAKASRSKEAGQLGRDVKAMQDAQERAIRGKRERLEHERQEREREEEEREQRRLERAREIVREREEKEREQRRLEKERERLREIEREREKARQAVERATKEARERAAAEARLKAERAAVEKVNAEARERAERAAVHRAQVEARERATAEAKERAEKAAAEAREGANTEAREKEACERAAVARAEAEMRLRTGKGCGRFSRKGCCCC